MCCQHNSKITIVYIYITFYVVHCSQSMPVLPTLSSTESLTSLDDEESKSANSDSAVENDDSTGDDDENGKIVTISCS